MNELGKFAAMRADRFLTLYFFRFLAKKEPKNGIRLPILMYHSISDEKESGHPYYWINTSPTRFAEHMKFLHDNNYQVISLSTAVDLIRQGSSVAPDSSNRQLPTSNQKPEVATSNVFSIRNPHSEVPSPITHNPAPRYVVLTFDDGYLDFYTRAFPILKRHGFSATVFLPTDYIDNRRPGLRGKDHLRWDEVRELAAEGYAFGSHTCTHSQLGDLKTQELEAEVKKSKEIIEDQTGRPVESFCHPYKFPDQDREFVRTLRSLLECAGYTSCATTRIGLARSHADEFFIPRLPVNSGDDRKLFQVKLRGGFDWLYVVQKASKKLASMRLG